MHLNQASIFKKGMESRVLIETSQCYS